MLRTCLLASAAHFLSVRADPTSSTFGSFVNPPMGAPVVSSVPVSQNPVWKQGSVQNIRWNFSMSTPSYTIDVIPINLTDNTEAGKFGIYIKYDTDEETGNFNWTVTPDIYDVAHYPVFLLELTTSEESEKVEFVLDSQHFNMSAADPSSVSSAPAASLSTMTISSTTAMAPSSTSSAASGPGGSPAGPKSAQQKGASHVGLGIGIGVGVAVLLLLSALIALWLLRRRRTAAARFELALNDKPFEELDGQERPAELPSAAERPPVEMPDYGDGRRPQELDVHGEKGLVVRELPASEP